MLRASSLGHVRSLRTYRRLTPVSEASACLLMLLIIGNEAGLGPYASAVEFCCFVLSLLSDLSLESNLGIVV